jgi:hypothetical protein
LPHDAPGVDDFLDGQKEVGNAMSLVDDEPVGILDECARRTLRGVPDLDIIESHISVIGERGQISNERTFSGLPGASYGDNREERKRPIESRLEKPGEE